MFLMLWHGQNQVICWNPGLQGVFEMPFKGERGDWALNKWFRCL